LAETLLRKQAIKRCYVFPHHLINAPTLPGKTANPEIVPFYVNVSCWLANRHTHKSQTRVTLQEMLHRHCTKSNVTRLQLQLVVMSGHLEKMLTNYLTQLQTSSSDCVYNRPGRIWWTTTSVRR